MTDTSTVHICRQAEPRSSSLKQSLKFWQLDIVGRYLKFSDVWPGFGATRACLAFLPCSCWSLSLHFNVHPTTLSPDLYLVPLLFFFIHLRENLFLLHKMTWSTKVCHSGYPSKKMQVFCSSVYSAGLPMERNYQCQWISYCTFFTEEQLFGYESTIFLR